MTLTPLRVSVSIESDLGRCYGTLPHGSRVLLGSLNVTPWHTLPRTVDSMSNTYNSLPSPIPLNFFTCSCRNIAHEHCPHCQIQLYLLLLLSVVFSLSSTVRLEAPQPMLSTRSFLLACARHLCPIQLLTMPASLIHCSRFLSTDIESPSSLGLRIESFLTHTL